MVAEPEPELLHVEPRPVDRRLLLVLGVGVLLVALVLGGLVIVDRVRGGASSPTLLAERVVDALDHEDLGALARLVEPGERTALERLLASWSRRLVELDLPTAVGGGAPPDPGQVLDGLDLTLSGTSAHVAARAGDLAVVALPDLVVRVHSDPTAASGALRTWFTYTGVAGPQDRTYAAAALESLGLAPRLVTVERKGRWYLSVLGTVLGPGIAEHGTLRVSAVDPVSSLTPQAAVETTLRALVEAIARRDVATVARTLDASGSDAVQLWASEVGAADAVGPPPRLDALVTTDQGSSGTDALVRVDTLRISGSPPVELDGPCLAAGGEKACLHRSGYRYADGVPGLSGPDVLGHGGGFWLSAVRDGDGWRTSLPDSVADALAAYADGLTREQVLALLRRPALDVPGSVLPADRGEDVTFTSAGYALRTLHVDRTGLYRVVPSPGGGNRASVYDAGGVPAIQPFYPNDSVYRLDPGDHTLLVWADDDFAGTLDQPGGAPYVQRVEVRSVR